MPEHRQLGIANAMLAYLTSARVISEPGRDAAVYRATWFSCVDLSMGLSWRLVSAEMASGRTLVSSASINKNAR